MYLILQGAYFSKNEEKIFKKYQSFVIDFYKTFTRVDLHYIDEFTLESSVNK